MNIWIAKLGRHPFSETDVAAFEASTAENINGYPALRSRESFQYHASGVHYLSAYSSPPFSSKTYNCVDSSRALYAFSGLLVGTRPSAPDYRSADTLRGTDLEQLVEHVCGQYAVINAQDRSFECVVDAIGSHKVFYYTSDDDTVYVTNHVPLMHLCKTPSRNLPALVEWIATEELFGYATQENDVSTLPEYGRLRWSAETGLHVGRYAALSTLVEPDCTDERELLDDTAREFKAAATYLAARHQNALSLSGGYDSRLALGIFSAVNPEAIECFTYPDHWNDVRIARSVAARAGFRQTIIRTSGVPSLEDVDRFIRNGWGLPFPDYRRVYDCALHEGISAIFRQQLKVRIIGLGGDLDLGLKKFPAVDSLSPPQAIAALTDGIIRHDILTPDGDHLLKQRLRDYLTDKYLPLLEAGKGRGRLTSMYFHLERFRGLQGFKQSQSSARLSDIFLPFASRRFIQTAFRVSPRALYRAKRDSVHHRLERKLTDGRLAGMPFSSHEHWDCGRLGRQQFRLRAGLAALINRVSGRTKYASRVRRDFFQQNVTRFSRLVAARPGSELWRYVDRDVVQGWLSGTRPIAAQDLHALHRILPFLASEREDDDGKGPD